MDFFKIGNRDTKNGKDIYPIFLATRYTDLIVRNGEFLAVWDKQTGLWSRDQDDLIRLVDAELQAKADELNAVPMLLNHSRSGSLKAFRDFCRLLQDSKVRLNQVMTFADTPPRKEDYSTFRLPYVVQEGPTPYYDEFMSTVFSEEDRHRLEWGVGAVITGEGKWIQKFISIYGAPGTGKGTYLSLLQNYLFKGYDTTFSARALGSARNENAGAPFLSFPLFATDPDSDLSRFNDNTLLNKIVGHEPAPLADKYVRNKFEIINAFLFVGTNSLVASTDAYAGLIRRHIAVMTTGAKNEDYDVMVSQMRRELGAIAYRCQKVYRDAGSGYYDDDTAWFHVDQTDSFRMFLKMNEEMLDPTEGITRTAALELYKRWYTTEGMEHHLDGRRFGNELRKYYKVFEDRENVYNKDGHRTSRRSVYKGFKWDMLYETPRLEKKPFSLVMDQMTSILDEELADWPAQYKHETKDQPAISWENVTTTLADLDTTREHYVKVPENRVVFDLDLRGDDGEKSLEKNLEAASKLRPHTYAEFSRSGKGIHMHYDYLGDASQLSRVLSEGIEIKTYPGGSSLRRRFSGCNNIPVAVLSEGDLPRREKKPVLNEKTLGDERVIRSRILRAIAKEIHPSTKPNIDYIHKVLEDAYNSGMPYDVTDLRQRIMVFANNSTNNKEYCLRKMMDMKFSSESEPQAPEEEKDQTLVFFDVEVFKNLFVVCWKFKGEGASIIQWTNPSADQIEELIKMPLVGFYNRRYDNHILFARTMGYSNEQLFLLSQKLVSKEAKNAYFGAAYDVSYADIWDFSSVKKSLKLFQIDLGLNHKELALPWDQPVEPEQIPLVLEYCANDVITTEQVFNDRAQDFAARQMLAALSGLPVNDTTYKHTAKIIFGDVKKPQADFVYTDLSRQFPGYKFDPFEKINKSTYRGEVVGEGGYVYPEPGMYENVAVLDIASMHPASIVLLDLFGPYTRNFAELRDARVAIKRGDYDVAGKILDGRLAPYLGSSEDAASLAYALKIIINTVYGLTAGAGDNAFRDPRNVDNIVAKRGALFMVDLKNAVQARGKQVIHIKTDSIKIPDADSSDIEFIIKFGEDYGYTFEHEATYDKFCLVDAANYIAKDAKGWTAVGAKFQHPFVFKILFSGDPLVFEDYCETREVKDGAALYLDMGEGPQFVGRAGSFVPVMEGTGGGILLRGKDGVFHSASRSKGYFWKEAALVKGLGQESTIDLSYFRKLVDEAAAAISEYGDLEWFRG